MRTLETRIAALEIVIDDSEARGIFITQSDMTAEQWDLVAPLAQALLVKETMQSAERVPVPGSPTQRL